MKFRNHAKFDRRKQFVEFTCPSADSRDSKKKAKAWRIVHDFHGRTIFAGLHGALQTGRLRSFNTANDT